MLSIYSKYCKGDGKSRQDIKDAVELLGWDIDPDCVERAARYLSMLSFVAGIGLIIAYLLYLVLSGLPVEEVPAYLLTEIAFGNALLILLLLLPFLLSLITYITLTSYPLIEKERVIKETIPQLPEIVGYIVMSMKLTPNLEKSLEFVSENTEGRLTEDFKKALWNVRMGFVNSTEEALDRIAYKWGKHIPEIKHALMQIRGAVLEPDEASRNIRLDQILGDTSNAVKERMEKIASSLQTPSVQLFYLGVLLPMLLLIIFPSASVFTDSPVLSPPVIAFIYLILLPVSVFIFSKSLLDRVPITYSPPVPPFRIDNQLVKKVALFVIPVLLVGVPLLWFAHLNLDTTYEKVEIDYCGFEGCLRGKYGVESWQEALLIDDIRSVIQSYDTTPYVLILGSVILFSIVVAGILYITQKDRLTHVKKVSNIEKEFKDALYVVASRMGEGKPFEGALSSLLEFMPSAGIVRHVFSKIIYNIKVLGLSLRDAIFDSTFGALKGLYSRYLERVFKVVVRAVELGTELAAKALISFIDQLRKEEEVLYTFRSKVADIAVMMNAMAVFVAPIVLGITVALQQIIVNTVQSFQPPEIPEELALELGISLPELNTPQEGIPTFVYLIITAVYNVLITALLTYYSVSMDSFRNTPEVLIKIGRNVVISSIIFAVTAYVSLSIVRGMV